MGKLKELKKLKEEIDKETIENMKLLIANLNDIIEMYENKVAVLESLNDTQSKLIDHLISKRK